MKQVPLSADVECSDGMCGLVTGVVIDPETHRVSQLVVRERKRLHTERLVPARYVTEISSRLVRLNCTDKELSTMSPLTTQEYRQVEIPTYVGSGYTEPVYVPQIQTLAVEEDHVPVGMEAVRQGAIVEATDGKVGRVDDLLVDPTTGDISHIIMRSGHPWGQRDVVVPVSLIRTMAVSSVYLKADRETIAALLAVPVMGRDLDIGLVAFLAENDAVADEVAGTLKKLASGGVDAVQNAAKILKDKDGKARISEIDDVGTTKGALFGALTGGLIGLLGGPVGVVMGAAAGAATGGIAARRIDMGFPEEFLEELDRHLCPGSAAIVAVVRREWLDDVMKTLSGFPGKMLHLELTEDVISQVTNAWAKECSLTGD